MNNSLKATPRKLVAHVLTLGADRHLVPLRRSERRVSRLSVQPGLGRRIPALG
jgi:hypothetical protein